ncbi:MAG TPA: erythromycin esterase family protein [Gemmatimonadales bacterium]|nr:erythromycin esterase family protein [Gemmatimonadales bacterium]
MARRSFDPAATPTVPSGPLAATLRDGARPLLGAADDYDLLLDLVGDARIVCLGEASHGTHEFYRERARITRRLVEEQGFTGVAVEADWPDAGRVNRFVRDASDDAEARQALGGFERFPRWMWRNRDVLEFVGWLRERNEGIDPARACGFYGLDLYSLFGSIDEVLGYLDRVDPEAARRARYRYSCFDQFGEDTQAYGYAAEFGITPSCEREAVAQLVDLQRRAGELAQRDGRLPEDEYFFAEQNARLVRNAEEYYRTMFRGRVSSWNLRDRHMAETLEALVAHLDRTRGGRTRVVVWEHNSHVGDARATAMGDQGEWNVGQLVRERWNADARLIGFTTYSGTVSAAADWDAPVERKRVRPALAGSYESLLHTVFGGGDVLLPLRDREQIGAALAEPRLERAIGVVYRPDTERISHYFDARLPAQFDAVLHFDATEAVEPLDRTAGWDQGEPPETYPSGL